MGSAGQFVIHGITLEYTQNRQFIYAKINPVYLRKALQKEPAFEVLLFEALEAVDYSSFAYQLDTEQLEDLSHMPWHTLHQNLVRRIATRTEFTLDVVISPDKMEAKARLQRAFVDEKVSEEGLVKRLAEYGVLAGINTSIFAPWLHDTNADDEYLLVAEGQLPVAGNDEQLMPLQQQLWVTADTPLAKHELATEGIAGYTVDGSPLPALQGRAHSITLDKHCRLQDQIVYAEITGIMLFTPFSISLSPAHTIKAVSLPIDEEKNFFKKQCEVHESLIFRDDLKDIELEVDGHLWIYGNCERVQLKVGGHLFVQGEILGPSLLQVGGCLWADGIRESSLMVSQQVYSQRLHTTQIFSGQPPRDQPPSMIQSLWHPLEHPFFESERQRLTVALRRLQGQTKACVQHLIEARKQEKELEVQDLLRNYQRLQRRHFFLESALAGYGLPFDPSFVFDPIDSETPTLGKNRI